MTDARQKALEALDRLERALRIVSDIPEECEFDDAKTIRKALQPQTVDVEGLIMEILGEHFVKKGDDNALAHEHFEFAVTYIASQGYLNAKDDNDD